MASFSRSSRPLYGEEIVLIPSLPLHSLFYKVPSLINGAELKRKVAGYPMLDKIVGLQKPKDDLKFKIAYQQKDLEKSYIFAGAPGTGKHALASASIRELVLKQGAILFHVTKNSMAATTEEERLAKVKDLFELAEKNQPAVILIENLENFLHMHMQPNDANWEIQCQMSRLQQLNGTVVVFGITSHPERLHDVAFRRFQKIIYCPPPTCTDRTGLVKALLEEARPWTNVSEYQLRNLGVDTPGFSRTDIAELVEDVLKKVPEPEKGRTVQNEGLHVLTIHHFYDKLNNRRGTMDKVADKWVRDVLTRQGAVIFD